MRNWQLQEARGRFKELFDGALEGKAQRVTRRGREAVVVVSEREWKRLNAPIPSWGELLTSFPVSAADLPKRRPLRPARKSPFG